MDQVTAPAGTTDANDIYANPPDPDVLELEPVHPGINDAAYVARRHELFALCRRYRLGSLGPPIIDYTDEEQRIWREVSPKLDELHDAPCEPHLSRREARAGHQRGPDSAAAPPQRAS